MEERINIENLPLSGIVILFNNKEIDAKIMLESLAFTQKFIKCDDSYKIFLVELMGINNPEKSLVIEELLSQTGKNNKTVILFMYNNLKKIPLII